MSTDSDSRPRVVLLEEIFPGDTNPYGTAFGGRILALMDRAAGLAASRHAHQHFVTASVDRVRFVAPVRQGEVAEVAARVVYTSRRTCGVKVVVSALSKTSWQRRPCCHGVILMVAMGPEGEILPVPSIEPRSTEERREWDEAAEIHRASVASGQAPP